MGLHSKQAETCFLPRGPVSKRKCTPCEPHTSPRCAGPRCWGKGVGMRLEVKNETGSSLNIYWHLRPRWDMNRNGKTQDLLPTHLLVASELKPRGDMYLGAGVDAADGLPTSAEYNTHPPPACAPTTFISLSTPPTSQHVRLNHMRSI